MARRFTGDTLVIASHNKGKVREIAELLGAYVAHFPSAAELGLPEPEETESTFIGNAELKARAAARASGLPALADDSGLVVPAGPDRIRISALRCGGFRMNLDRAILLRLSSAPYRSPGRTGMSNRLRAASMDA
jgi:hypothetical protein